MTIEKKQHEQEQVIEEDKWNTFTRVRQSKFSKLILNMAFTLKKKKIQLGSKTQAPNQFDNYYYYYYYYYNNIFISSMGKYES